MGTSAALRKANERYARSEDKKRGKPAKKHTSRAVSSISTPWLSKYTDPTTSSSTTNPPQSFWAS